VQHSGPIVSATLALPLPLKIQTYDPKIADFAGGRPVRVAPFPTAGLLADRAAGAQAGLPAIRSSAVSSVQTDTGFVQALLSERDRKNQRLRFRELRERRFKRKGKVVVEEIEQDDET